VERGLDRCEDARADGIERQEGRESDQKRDEKDAETGENEERAAEGGRHRVTFVGRYGISRASFDERRDERRNPSRAASYELSVAPGRTT
jgi:hypothetical protein